MDINNPSSSQEELEKIILGTILYKSQLSYAQELHAEYFVDSRNKVIFDIMRHLYESGQQIDYPNVLDSLKRKGIDSGNGYLSRLKEKFVNEDLFAEAVKLLKAEYFRKKKERGSC